MADKLMYIFNDDTQNTPSVDYNQQLEGLDTQLSKPSTKKKIPLSY